MDIRTCNRWDGNYAGVLWNSKHPGSRQLNEWNMGGWCSWPLESISPPLFQLVRFDSIAVHLQPWPRLSSRSYNNLTTLSNNVPSSTVTTVPITITQTTIPVPEERRNSRTSSIHKYSTWTECRSQKGANSTLKIPKIFPIIILHRLTWTGE